MTPRPVEFAPERNGRIFSKNRMQLAVPGGDNKSISSVPVNECKKNKLAVSIAYPRQVPASK